MTKDLTEQWKNGGLKKDKKYYTKDKLGRTYIKTYNKKGFKGLVEEVLCEVPSYEKWNAVLESNESLFETIQVLKKRLIEVAEENAKLKETIKRTKANGNYPSRVSAYKSRIATLREENQKLKELLKECREAIVNGLYGL